MDDDATVADLNTVQKSKNYKKEIILLLVTIILLLIIGELFFRFYYLHNNKPIASDENELCFKHMKTKNDYVSVTENSVTFREDFEEDALIGIVPKKNYASKLGKLVAVADKKIKLSLVYAANYHNSQSLTNLEEFTVEKPKTVSKRIALFGDSFTCGAEMPLKFNMNYVLKEMMPDLEILNFCVIGYGIDTMYARYVLESKQYKPDVVIFNILVDDLRRAYGCPLFRPNLIISNNNLIIGQRKWASLTDFYFNYSLPKYESYFMKHVLYVIDQNTRLKKANEHGFELFKVMVDKLKIQTIEQNATLIITPLLEENPQQYDVELYKKMIDILKERNVTFMDSKEYLSAQKKAYNNQSFYYIRNKDKFAHFSAIGNAVFAQGLRHVMENLRIIQKTPDYYFANFKDDDFVYFIPENLEMQMQGQIRAVPAFDAREYLNQSFVLQKAK